MTREEIRERVVNVTAQQLNVPAGDIKDTDQFAFDLGADSLKSIELVAAFEEEFDLSVNEDEALKVQTVEAAVEFFDKLLN